MATQGLPTYEEQKATDRAILRPIGQRLGAAAMDVGTLPVRALLGVGNTLTRGVNALLPPGYNVPYAPESSFGGDSSSLTPYMDKLDAATPPAPAPAPAPAAPVVAKQLPDAAYAAEGAGQGNPRVNATQRVAKPAAPQAPALAAVPAWDASSPENAAAIAALPPGVVQQFTDGSTSFGSVPGRGGDYIIPGQSAPLVQPAGGGGNLVQVIRGGQSSYTRPDGTGIALYPTMAGPLSELSQPQRARDAAVNYGHELSAKAAIEGHRLAAGATLGAATIHETGATDRAETQATTAANQLAQMPRVIGQRLEALSGFPPVPVNVYGQSPAAPAHYVPIDTSRPSASNAPPLPGHVANLRANRGTADAFDAKYGPGAAKRALGQ